MAVVSFVTLILFVNMFLSTSTLDNALAGKAGETSVYLFFTVAISTNLVARGQ